VRAYGERRSDCAKDPTALGKYGSNKTHSGYVIRVKRKKINGAKSKERVKNKNT